MKILLIYPDTDPLSIIPKGLINIEPLGLEYLAGALYDYDVKILDMKITNSWRKQIQKYHPNVVGITGTVIHTKRMLSVLKYIKEIYPEIYTVVGGPHASLMPDDFYQNQVDFLIQGQNSDSFKKLIDSIDSRKDLNNIEGLMIKNGDGWMTAKPVRPICNLDHLPMPRRDLTAQYRHKYCHLFWKPVALMVTSVGCPHACNFCPCPVLTDRKVLRRSPEFVLQDLRHIHEPYVYIGDDNLFFDSKHAMRIADQIEKMKIKKHYYVLSRVDSIIKHPELIEKWAQVGLKKVFLGLESPTDSEIKALNKKGTVSQNNQAIEILQANNVDPLGAFIINPSYTREDFNRILEYMDKMNIYYFEFTILTPFPGTKFYDDVNGDILSQDRQLFDLAHSLLPTNMPINKFYKEYSRLHRRAASPLRAMRIRPTVSPFRQWGYLRRAPQFVNLILSARKAYKELESV